MRIRKYLVGTILGLAVLAAPGVALADSCANVSRPPAECGFSCAGPVIEGNWVWLPSIGVDFPAWGFAPPGAEETFNPHGNYTNGKTDSLLGVSAICNGGATARQQTHGIQSGCE